MKMNLVMMALTVLSLQIAIAANAQRVTIDVKKATVRDVLLKISKQTGYDFIYDPGLIRENSRITMNVDQVSLEEALTTCFGGKSLDLMYKDDRMVVIKARKQLSTSATIQQREITGRVTNEQGQPLSGVTVRAKGSAEAVVTDDEGSYRILIPQAINVIVFTIVGFELQELTIGTSNVINTVMEESVSDLEEVVVVGYGTMKRRDIIGSVATVTGADINKVPVANLSQSMQGMASGLFISNSSGHPGSSPDILIRGLNSINLGTSPLWVIDGVPIYTGSSQLEANGVKPVSAISMINPADIESIEVLKDAAATAVYGSRGSGGVILVTTKSNKGGASGVSVNYDGGVSALPFKQEDIWVDSKTWWELHDEAYANSGFSGQVDPNTIIQVQFLDVNKPSMTREEASAINSDHLGALTQTAKFNQFGLTANKGFETGGVLFSLNYRNEEGILRNNDFERLTGRFNFNFSPIEQVSMGINMNLQYLKNKGVPQSHGKGAAGGWSNLITMLPWYLIEDETSQSGYWFPNSGYNAMASSDPALVRNESDMYRTISNAFVEWNTPVDGLRVRGEVGVDLMLTNSSSWTSILMSTTPYQSEAAELAITKRTVNLNGYATYERDLGNHHIHTTVGAEAIKGHDYVRRAEGTQIYSNYPELINPMNRTVASGRSNYAPAILGVFGRVNYKYNDRYILNFSIRQDGHGAFSEENRWATFTAVGAGWLLSEESFFDSQDIDLLKIRGSYGQTGNTNVNQTMTQMNWDLTRDQYGGDFLPGSTSLGPMGNRGLRWETTSNMDVGLDFGLFNSRISGSVAYYRQRMTNLILKGNVPWSTGFGINELWENVGDMENWGWEFSVSSVNVAKAVRWSTDFNISLNENKVTGLNEFEKGKGYEGTQTIRKEGERLNTWYLSNFVHVDPQTGIPMIEQRDEEKWNNDYMTVSTGRLIPMNESNTNANKMIQSGKSDLPTFYGGLTNTIRYKAFDLNILLTFAGGHYLLNLPNENTNGQGSYRTNGISAITTDLVGNYWKNPGDIAKYPKLVYDDKYPVDNDGNPSEAGTNFSRNINSTFLLEKADYIKLRNLQLGYTFPASVANRMKLQNVRMYVGGINLLTLTGYSGYDPETGNQLPLPRTVNFGLSFNL
ncbi:SusC/RagA family TonB-linked outer membrane protein [Parapedobacter tibetensis]|uniref:SusC/RagA family TonB-linked outer membrane protein n=1 Tax=Parapedobacter tibetensis TaxID=2972951 RepID=UPI00214D3649|nr:SusC/RagA family TonB-linked outer membrane protein [Parapedobacter tibetensis]